MDRSIVMDGSGYCMGGDGILSGFVLELEFGVWSLVFSALDWFGIASLGYRLVLGSASHRLVIDWHCRYYYLYQYTLKLDAIHWDLFSKPCCSFASITVFPLML